jgi:hypothetical protein
LLQFGPIKHHFTNNSYRKLQNILKKNDSRVADRLDPENITPPTNLIYGGHKLIQHAGNPNYNQLKQSINDVSLDDILIESKSLFQQINN